MEIKYDELLECMKKYGYSMESSAKFYLKGDMPSKKIDNALKSFAEGVDRSNIIGIYDITITGSFKSGFMFTNSGMYIKDTFEKPKYIKYSDISSATITNKKKAKDCDRYLEVKDVNGNTMEITSTLINKTPLRDFLLEAQALSVEGKTNKTDKFLILEDMEEEVKENYIKVIVNFVNADNVITDQELSRIYSLMTRIRTDVSTRENIMRYLAEDCNVNTNELLEAMDNRVPNSTLEVIHLSLIKDMLKSSGCRLSSFSQEQKDFMSGITQKYGISSEKVDFLEKAIEIDEKFLSGKIDDKSYVKMMGDLGSKAAAVGVPIAAVYLSGSVVGLSAAGITSGLATLGLGGVLGLSSMVTGVGVVVLLGVAAYSGIKWISGKGTRDKENKREFLLQEALKMNQETINNLIEDINNLTAQLVEVISQNEINEETIVRLKKKLVLYSNAFKQSRKTGKNMENSYKEVVAD